MANKVERYEAKTAEDFARWLGHIDPLKVHKIYVKRNKGAWHCMAILHDVGSKPGTSVTGKVLEDGARQRKRS